MDGGREVGIVVVARGAAARVFVPSGAPYVVVWAGCGMCVLRTGSVAGNGLGASCVRGGDGEAWFEVR